MSQLSGAVVLRSEALEVVLLPEVGGRLHAVRAFGHDLLRTPDDPAAHRRDPFFWGAYPMAPWCNRAVAGEGQVAGERVRLKPNFPDGSAIHGLVSSAPWEVRDQGKELAVRAGGPGTGWPWQFEVTLRPTVAASLLELDYRVANLAERPMPAGIGLHPWFRRPLEVRLPAALVYPANTGSAPEPEQVAGDLDLRRLAPPAADLDGSWTALSEGAFELAWPSVGVEARVEVTTNADRPVVALASPEGIEAVAIEPQTHGPDPLRRLERGEPDAPLLLEPGGEIRLVIRVAVGLARNVR
jgi:aldose 1-epimerase